MTSFVEMHAPLSPVVVRREITRLFAKKAVNGLRQVLSLFHSHHTRLTMLSLLQKWHLRSSLPASSTPEAAVSWNKNPQALRAALVLMKRAGMTAMKADSSARANIKDAVFSHVAAELWKRDNDLRGLPARCSLTSNVLGCLRLNMESELALFHFVLSDPELAKVTTFAPLLLLTRAAGALLLTLGPWPPA